MNIWRDKFTSDYLRVNLPLWNLSRIHATYQSHLHWVNLQTSQVLKFPKSEIFAGDYAKGWSVLCFLCGKGQKITWGVRGHAPSENLLNSLGMHRRVCHLSFKPFLLRASMLLWSAWANTRNKKLDRTRIDWTLAEVQCRWWNEFGIHEHFWKLKTLSYLPEQCECVRNARVGVRPWVCIEMSETHAQCVRLESSGTFPCKIYRESKRTLIKANFIS